MNTKTMKTTVRPGALTKTLTKIIRMVSRRTMMEMRMTREARVVNARTQGKAPTRKQAMCIDC